MSSSSPKMTKSAKGGSPEANGILSSHAGASETLFSARSGLVQNPIIHNYLKARDSQAISAMLGSAPEWAEIMLSQEEDPKEMVPQTPQLTELCVLSCIVGAPFGADTCHMPIVFISNDAAWVTVLGATVSSGCT